MENLAGSNANDLQDAVIIVRDASRTPSIHERDSGFEWNGKHERLLRNWSDHSARMEMMHKMASESYKKWHHRLGIPGKIVMTVVAIVQFAQLASANQTCDSGSWAFYMSGFAAFGGLISELSKDWLSYDTLASKHESAANVYYRLQMQIHTELTYPPAKRTNIRSFLRSVQAKLTNVREISPDVPSRIADSYVRNEEKQQQSPVILPVTSQIETRGDDHEVDDNHTDNDRAKNLSQQLPPSQFVSQPLPQSLPLPPTEPVLFSVADDHQSFTPATMDLQEEFTSELQRQLDQQQQMYQMQRLHSLSHDKQDASQ